MRRGADHHVLALHPQDHADPAGDAALDAETGALAAKLGGAGWLKYTVPAAHGGALENLDARSLCIARLHLAYHSGHSGYSRGVWKSRPVAKSAAARAQKMTQIYEAQLRRCS